jgi:hypothetical protein
VVAASRQRCCGAWGGVRAEQVTVANAYAARLDRAHEQAEWGEGEASGPSAACGQPPAFELAIAAIVTILVNSEQVIKRCIKQKCDRLLLMVFCKSIQIYQIHEFRDDGYEQNTFPQF